MFNNRKPFFPIYITFSKGIQLVWGGNLLAAKGVFRDRTVIRIQGRNNKVLIERGLTRLKGCSISIMGSSNVVHIGRGCKLTNASLHIEDNGGDIEIGCGTIISGNTHMAVIEGKKVTIGKDCLFSANITLRTGDSHSVLEKAGKRINPSKDIMIGIRVWIGNTVIILKGAKINDNCVVAIGSLLTGKEYPSNSIIGGIGGQVLKGEIDWCGERIPIKNQI